MWYPWTKPGPSRAPPVFPPDFGTYEPLLADVLDDPDIRRLMACDGVAMTDLVALIGRTRKRLQ